MGHHFNSAGQFQSDKYPELGPDKIVVSFKHPEAHAALRALADGYAGTDPELAEDIRARLKALAGDVIIGPMSVENAIAEVSRLTLGERDIVLVKTPHLPADAMNRMHRRFSEAYPQLRNVQLLIVRKDIDFEKLPEDAARRLRDVLNERFANERPPGWS